jgi:hypothetical protein
MKKTTLIGVAGLFTVFATALTAGQSIDRASSDPQLSEWEKVAQYEPCMNGAVSATGLYPSQVAEDKSFATLGFIAGEARLP